MTPRGAALAVEAGGAPGGLSSFSSLSADLAVVRGAEHQGVEVSGLCTSVDTVCQQTANAPAMVQPWPTMHHVHQGKALGVGERVAVYQDEYGEQRDARRKKPVPWADLLADAPERWREATDRVGRVCYPEGEVPSSVAWAWGFLRDVYAQVRGGSSEGDPPSVDSEVLGSLGQDLEWLQQLMSCKRGLLAPSRFWPSLLPLALEFDAHRLGKQQRAACGASTWEGVVQVGSEQEHRVWRYTCGSERCRHCSKRKGLARQAPIANSLDVHADEGRFGWFLTLTLSPKQLMGIYGVSWRAARMLSWRRCRPNMAVFITRMRRNGIDVRYVARTEAHSSGFAHLHPLLVSEELTRRAVEEAQCGSFDELVALVAKDRAAYEAKEAAWKAGGSRGRKPPRRCRFPKLRQQLKRWAISAGWGASMFWLEPVRDSEDVASYVAKDTFSIPDVVGEVTKTRQLAGRLIPRGTKTWNYTRGDHAFFVSGDDPEGGDEPEERQTITLTRHLASIEEVRQLAEADELGPCHEVHGRDMRGEPPGKGGQWPLELQSLMLDIPIPAGVLPLLTGLPRLARGPP